MPHVIGSNHDLGQRYHAAELASFVLAPSGYPDEAVVQSEKAISLSPNYPAVYLGTLGNAYRL